MIPMIIQLITGNLSNIISWFKGNFKLIAVIIIGIFTAIICLQRNQLQNKNNEIDRLNNNIEYYQNLNDSTANQNNILQLTVDEFKNSNDSIVNKLNNARKELNIKTKELKQAQHQAQEIKLDTTVIVKDNNFIKEIKPNSLTSLLIIKKDSLLTAKLDIKNEQSLIVSTKRKYKRQYKNWFRRLLRFDFKKHNVNRYNIINSNDLIKITDTRVIEMPQ